VAEQGVGQDAQQGCGEEGLAGVVGAWGRQWGLGVGGAKDFIL
jgi:hypothetical protein